jgi:PKD repeat protein
MWSNQVTSTTYFAVHNDSDAAGTWQSTESVTIPGPKQSDDHLNVKQLQTDNSGRIWAVIKTGLDDVGAGQGAPQIVVLNRGSRGGWSRATFGTIADCHTRPVLMLDSTNNLVHVYATAPDSGCPFSGSVGSIFEKTSPMDNLSFPSGRGTPVMRSAASPGLNNVTGSKQTVDGSTGIVMLASNDDSKQYWASDESLGTGTVTKPTASFSANPTAGTAPLTVQFTDMSTGSPTAWAWDFGDGGTASTQNPSHTYTASGTYVVKLTASNAGGSSTATATMTVGPAPAGSGITVVGSQSASASIANGAVTLTSPTSALAGDVLVAEFTVDDAATVTPPAGWTRVLGPLAPDAGAEVFAYYHVVGATETPGTYTWPLSVVERWSGGITAYRGVDTAHPLDVASPSTKTACTVTTRSITAPGVTTVTAGAVLIGGLGADGRNVNTNPPAGWTEAFDKSDGQMSEHAYNAQPIAGSSGTVTWTTDDVRCLAVWVSALRPGS